MAAQVVSRSLPVTIGIKVAAPNLKIAHEWGDYHYGKQLAAALQRRGWVARVDCADEWQTQGDDVNLVLRGRHRCLVDAGAVNLMWQISHPDRLAGAETRDFDHLFVASDIHSRALSNQTSTPVSTLHQATDPAVFRPTVKKLNLAQSALFVGNSRKEYRTIVRWCVEQGIDLAVFGSRWTDVIPDHYVLGTHILNEDLHRWYGSCEILLNDHWDTMREEGFLSNRLFDGSAAGAFIITDPVRGLAEVFGDAIETAADPRELKDKVTYYLAHPEERAARAERARAIVMANHTFDHRADDIIAVYEVIARRRGLGRFFTDEAQLV
ncbi:MAG: hypothetical protein JWR75_361 [Devosia sp.]|nr:hypothetical protein [Devosia sp.]